MRSGEWSAECGEEMKNEKYNCVDDVAIAREIEKLKKEASEQLEESAQDEMVRYWIERGKKLKKITIIYHGWELVYIEDKCGVNSA